MQRRQRVRILKISCFVLKCTVTFLAFDKNRNGYVEKREIVEILLQSYNAAFKLAITSETAELDSAFEEIRTNLK